MFVAYFVFIRSHFWTQGKLTTNCDGSVKHGKWQEPAGTLSVALTAYMLHRSTRHGHFVRAATFASYVLRPEGAFVSGTFGDGHFDAIACCLLNVKAFSRLHASTSSLVPVAISCDPSSCQGHPVPGCVFEQKRKTHI